MMEYRGCPRARGVLPRFEMPLGGAGDLPGTTKIQNVQPQTQPICCKSTSTTTAHGMIAVCRVIESIDVAWLAIDLANIVHTVGPIGVVGVSDGDGAVDAITD